MIVSFYVFELFQDQSHDAGQKCRENRHTDSAQEPFLTFVLHRDIGTKILRAGDNPIPGMSDPITVDQDSVDQVHDRQNHETLPEDGPEASGAVDRADADERVNHISRKAEEPEAIAPPPDRLPGRQAQRNHPVLYFLIIEMRHPDGALPDADGADEIQQEAQAQSFQNEFYREHLSSSFNSLIRFFCRCA